MLFRAVVGLLVLDMAGVGNLFAADAAAPAVPVERSIVEKTVDQAMEQTGEKLGEQNVARIDDAHADQERFFGKFFEKVDRIFGEQYVVDRERKVQIRVGLETTFNDDGTSIDTGVNLGLRVPLPAAERRFNSFINIGGDMNELGAVSNPNFSKSEKNYSVTARLLGRLRDNLEAGIALDFLRSFDAIFSVRPFVRFEQRSDSMRYYFEQQIIWDSDNSWDTRTDLDLDRTFGSKLFLRLRNRGEYSFADPGASVAHGLIVRRGVFETDGLSLELWLEYNTAKDDPTTIKDDTILYAQLRLRGRIWRNWLEYELRPIYTIPIDTDRTSFFGFFVSLTVVWDSYLGGGDTADTNLDR